MTFRVGLRLKGDDRGWLLDPDPGARVDLLLEETFDVADVWMSPVCDLCIAAHVVGYFCDAALGCPWNDCEGCGEPPIPLKVA